MFYWDEWMGGWGLGLEYWSFFAMLYICFTTCSIGIGIGFTCTIERLLIMERMEYHSSVVIIYIAKGVWISTSMYSTWGG